MGRDFVHLHVHSDYSLLDGASAISWAKLKDPAGKTDIVGMAKEYGMTDQSLQKIYAILFDKKISKAQRLSNWENAILTDKQKTYAATDAWTTLRIYEKLIDINPDNVVTIVKSDDTTQMPQDALTAAGNI